MTIESFGQNLRGPVEKKALALIDEDPVLRAMGLTHAEGLIVAKIVAEQLAGSKDVDEMALIRRAAEARLDVRGTSGKIPVFDKEGGVIGMASSPNEAKEMSRQDNETRDVR